MIGEHIVELNAQDELMKFLEIKSYPSYLPSSTWFILN